MIPLNMVKIPFRYRCGHWGEDRVHLVSALRMMRCPECHRAWITRPMQCEGLCSFGPLDPSNFEDEQRAADS